MIYPEEFKQQCREAFPENKELSMLLDSGSRMVGAFLEQVAPTGVDFDVVINATSLEELKEFAKKQKKIASLRKQWLKLDNGNRYRIYHS